MTILLPITHKMDTLDVTHSHDEMLYRDELGPHTMTGINLTNRKECTCVLRGFSRVQLFARLWRVACQAPLSIGFSRQDYWSGLPYPLPGESSQPRNGTCVSCIQADSLSLSCWGSPQTFDSFCFKN